jgi:hypothetical protein
MSATQLIAHGPNGSRLVSQPAPSAAARNVFEKLRARGYAVAAVLAVAPAMAAELPLSAPIANQESFPTMQAAADAAAHAVIACSVEYECGAALYQDSAGYRFTAPATAGRATEIDYRVALPPGAKLSALMHGHPGTTGTAEEFSDSDKALQRRMRLPLYVVAIAAHMVIGLGAPGFSLDVTPVNFQTIQLAGITYRVLGTRGNHLLLEYNGREFLAPKSVVPQT